MFLGEGRKAFLEFLRNLTPQILFLTLALVIGSKLDFRTLRLDATGIKNAAPFVLCVWIFFGAALANMTMFIDAVITSNAKLDSEVAAIKKKGLKPMRLTLALLGAAWQHNRTAFAQTLLSLLVVEIAFVGVFIVALQGAMASPLLHK